MTLTGRVKIGRYCHISTGASVFGGEGFEMGDFSGLSVGVKVFTATEDLSGEWALHPTLPAHVRKPIAAFIRIAEHCSVGAGSVLLPGADLPEGACVGALSLVKQPLTPWSIWAGIPARLIKLRCKRARDLVNNLETP